LSPQTRVGVFFVLCGGGGGGGASSFGHYYIGSGAGSFDLTAHAGTCESPV
jgi:hypothetical protein